VNRHRIESVTTGLGAEAGFPPGTPKKKIVDALTKLFRSFHKNDDELRLVEPRAILPKREK
jgi:hypothetical protein